MTRRSLHRLLRRYVLTGSFRKQKPRSREYVSRPVFVERLQAELSTTTPFFASQAMPRGTLYMPPSPHELAKMRREWTKPHTAHWLDTPWWAFWR